MAMRFSAARISTALRTPRAVSQYARAASSASAAVQDSSLPGEVKQAINVSLHLGEVYLRAIADTRHV